MIKPDDVELKLLMPHLTERGVAFLCGFASADQVIRDCTHSVLAYQVEPRELIKEGLARAYWAEMFARECISIVERAKANQRKEGAE